MRFSPDGRVFVAEKAGSIKVFDSLTRHDADRLRRPAHEGLRLLGHAACWAWRCRRTSRPIPYVYVLYSYDGPIGGTAPRWNDACPTPPGPMTDGCPGQRRASSRLQGGGQHDDRVRAGPGQRLVPAAPRALDRRPGLRRRRRAVRQRRRGAHPDQARLRPGRRQRRQPGPQEPVRRPARRCGRDAHAAHRRGRRAAQPEPAAARPGEPARPQRDDHPRQPGHRGGRCPTTRMVSSADANERRIVAYGLRNPFRITVRPGTNELWIGDVGMGAWEEIDRVANPRATPVKNFGWPCYEGPNRQSGVGRARRQPLRVASTRPARPTPPFYAYNHAAKVVPGESLRAGQLVDHRASRSPFYSGGPYPPAYDGALFFADRARRCIWAMLRNGSPRCPTRRASRPSWPTPPTRSTCRSARAATSSTPTSTAARSSASATPPATRRRPRSPPASPYVRPRRRSTVQLRRQRVLRPGPRRHDADLQLGPRRRRRLRRLDVARSRRYTYTDRRARTSAKLTVTDTARRHRDRHGDDHRRATRRPRRRSRRPRRTFTWARRRHDRASAARRRTPRTGRCPASALSWSVIMHHCPSNCHTHPVQDFPGVASGSFAAPDHEYPSYLELRLTATDSGGLTGRQEPAPRPQDRRPGTSRSVPVGADAVAQHDDRDDARSRGR